MGRYEEAIKAYEAAIKLDPNDAEARTTKMLSSRNLRKLLEDGALIRWSVPQYKFEFEVPSLIPLHRKIHLVALRRSCTKKRAAFPPHAKDIHAAV